MRCGHPIGSARGATFVELQIVYCDAGEVQRDFVLMENGVVWLFTLVVGVLWMFFYLGGWCCVDVVEESLEIVAGKRTVHLLVRPCIGFR